MILLGFHKISETCLHGGKLLLKLYFYTKNPGALILEKHFRFPLIRDKASYFMHDCLLSNIRRLQVTYSPDIFSQYENPYRCTFFNKYISRTSYVPCFVRYIFYIIRSMKHDPKRNYLSLYLRSDPSRFLLFFYQAKGSSFSP